MLRTPVDYSCCTCRPLEPASPVQRSFLSTPWSRRLESGKRDSNPRPQPWQGCALPTELFPQECSPGPLGCYDRYRQGPRRVPPTRWRSDHGGEGNRTPDLLNAIQALSQLSYAPETAQPLPRGTSAALTTVRPARPFRQEPRNLQTCRNQVKVQVLYYCQRFAILWLQSKRRGFRAFNSQSPAGTGRPIGTPRLPAILREAVAR